MGLVRELICLLKGELRPTRSRHEAIGFARNLSIRCGRYVTAEDLEREREEVGSMFPASLKRPGYGVVDQEDFLRPE